MLVRLLVICSVIVACKADFPPTEEYPHSAILDAQEKVKLYWKFDDVYITFEVHGNTPGWVGMGISPSGSMTGADIVVGWVVDGNTVITDRHGVGNQLPPLDPEQNIETLAGMESDGWTVIKFKRQIASCDPLYDSTITGNTLKIIYAYGASEPSEGNDLTGSFYHLDNRGSKSLILLEAAGADESNFPDGEIHSTFDLLNENFEIPTESTYYNCRLFKIPEFSQKQHVVKVEPVIQPGNELFVHHMLLYQCTDTVIDSENVGTNTRCYASDMPPDFVSCSFVIQAWAIGGTDMYYPIHVGFPLGESDSPRYVVLETHYDNPLKQAGVVDSSGLRFTYTSQLRQFDAGIISAGHTVSGIQHIIPPNADSFLSHGECSQNCLEENMKFSNLEKINVFGVLLHSHLLGTGLTLRHFRNSTELPYITKDDAYDFNYQETRRLPEEREVLRGDSFQVICNYKTSGVRIDISMGGLSTEKEMCTAFLYYYPKTSLAYCETAPEYNAFINHFGIEAAMPASPNFGAYSDLNDLVIVSPQLLAGKTIFEHVNAMTWDKTSNKRLEYDLRDMFRIQNCRATTYVPNIELYLPAPVIDVPYEEEPPVCLTNPPTSTVESIETTSVTTSTTAPMTSTTEIVTSTTAPMTSTAESVTSTMTTMTFTEAPMTSTAEIVTSTTAPMTSTAESVTSTMTTMTFTEAPMTSTAEIVTSTTAPMTSTAESVTSTMTTMTFTEAPMTSTAEIVTATMTSTGAVVTPTTATPSGSTTTSTVTTESARSTSMNLTSSMSTLSSASAATTGKVLTTLGQGMQTTSGATTLSSFLWLPALLLLSVMFLR